MPLRLRGIIFRRFSPIFINTLKKLTPFLLASLLIISCRKDDDKKPELMINGTWNLTKNQIMSGKDNSILFSEAITDCPEKRNYQFSNNNYTLTFFKDNFAGSCVAGGKEDGTFSYNNTESKITFKSSRTNNTYSMNINSMTSTEMQLADPFYGYDVNNDGIADKFVLVLSKQERSR